ncbi:ferritin-like domain-containing protein [Parageobacillus thermoglucosidasius]|uniref:Ferritin-like domain-containing protein n=1 Tax=Parageobacillus thermoglucosidasius TaxID=1426 RepID=A0AAN1D6B5_PARTM|nr:ferritin-like domain-containing protein [Parageobacillus thermoglucosidasius]ALF09886.1 hypothetical protein AOT13_07660 [Parageobacillus thermoglucosidasius]ANZ29968.1 hypothetical protein BCV53_07670 [Parageobacillus thermoglucosidasius]APM80706.1 hypothetical protein BCV54_07675 [Parageobacillus thermoglucosidasius]KJX70291.1 hypothetical protein WH82_01385 [Parageobacillus thermoglucosidasius]RDE21293.1 ferritin-like domain-containing protein [Parageobacillus thermoglucosidasius]
MFKNLVHFLMKEVPNWKYHMLHQNTTDEASGSLRVDLMGERSGDPRIQQLMHRHALDVERHSRLFGGLLQDLGGELEIAESEEMLKKWDDIKDYHEDLIVFTARVHTIEMRSWRCLKLYIDYLSNTDFVKEGWPEKTLDVLNVILNDEIRHVGYTGMLLHEWAANGKQEEVEAALEEAFRQTNRETWTDMSRMMDYLAKHYC